MTDPGEVPAAPTPAMHHELWRREWWSVARVALDAGHDVLVLDPDVAGPETWSLDGDVVLEVYPTRAAGWQLIVRQVEADPLEDE